MFPLPTKLAMWLLAGVVLVGLSVWAGYRLAPKANTITQYVDRIVTQTITTKPDGTVVQSTTSSVISKPDPAVPKPNYSVAITTPVKDPSALRTGIEVGLRMVKDLWGVAGFQQDQGVHVGVRVEF